MGDPIKWSVEFLKMLSPNIQVGLANQVLEIYGSKNPLTTEKLENFIGQHKADDLYYLGGVDDGVKDRANDDQITRKNYLVFDLDIGARENYSLTPEQIKQKGREIALKLQQSRLFTGYRAIIYSGNGIHIIYIGEEIDCRAGDFFPVKEEYAAGVKYLQHELEKIVGYAPDPACCNLGRIMRLPGSYNRLKRKIDGKVIKTEPVLVEFLELELMQNKTQNDLLSMVLIFGVDELTVKKSESQNQIIRAEAIKICGQSKWDMIDNIPIGDLVALKTGFRFDGRNFYDDKGDKKAMWAPKDKNMVITSSSPHIDCRDLGCGPFTFVKYNMGNGRDLTDREVFEWFEGKYPEIKNNSSQNIQKKWDKKIWDLNEILKMPRVKEPWLIEDFIKEKAINSITAESGAGKSLLMAIMVRSIITGKSFFDEFKAKKTNTLIIDLEMDDNEIIERCQYIYSDVQVSDGTLEILHSDSWRIDDQNDFDGVIDYIKEKNIGLLVIDTFNSSHGRDENSASEMREINMLMLKIIQKTDITILHLHHHRKTLQGVKDDQLEIASSRGSSEIEAKLGSHIAIKSIQQKQTKNDVITDVLTITGKQVKRRGKGAKISFQAEVWIENEKTLWNKKEITAEALKIEMAQDWVEEQVQAQEGKLTKSDLERMLLADEQRQFGKEILKQAIASLKLQKRLFVPEKNGINNSKYLTTEDPNRQAQILDN